MRIRYPVHSFILLIQITDFNWDICKTNDNNAKIKVAFLPGTVFKTEFLDVRYFLVDFGDFFNDRFFYNVILGIFYLRRDWLKNLFCLTLLKRTCLFGKIRQTPQRFVNSVCRKGKNGFLLILQENQLEISFFNALNRLWIQSRYRFAKSVWYKQKICIFENCCFI